MTVRIAAPPVRGRRHARCVSARTQRSPREGTAFASPRTNSLGTRWRRRPTSRRWTGASSCSTARSARTSQGLDLTADDFGGAALEGCNEMLCLTRPDVIAGMHAAFFDVGVDAVETASFGSFSTVLAEYDVADRAHDLNVAAARIAREVADDYAADGRARFVAGSIGPGTKLPSLGHIGFPELRDAVRGAGQRPARRRRRPLPRRDVHGPVAGQGGDDRLSPGDGRRSDARSRSRCR